MFTPLHAFAHSHGSDFIPYLALFHNITDLEVNTFLNQDSCRLPEFLSNLVTIFHAGEPVLPATDQPEYRAVGHPL